MRCGIGASRRLWHRGSWLPGGQRLSLASCVALMGVHGRGNRRRQAVHAGYTPLNHFFAWQGNVFGAAAGVLKNHITPFGLTATIAKVYAEPSWLDGKCIVLDYSNTSIIAHWCPNEIRLISPNFYLGKVYCDEERLIDFCRQF